MANSFASLIARTGYNVRNPMTKSLTALMKLSTRTGERSRAHRADGEAKSYGPEHRGEMSSRGQARTGARTILAMHRYSHEPE